MVSGLLVMGEWPSGLVVYWLWESELAGESGLVAYWLWDIDLAGESGLVG